MAVVYGGSYYGIEPLGSPSLVITGITPDPIDDEGGTLMTATGSFPANTSLQVFLGTTGTVADEPCYGGFGYGYFPQSSDGTTLEFVSPPLPKEALNVVTIKWGAILAFFNYITVVERHWRSKTFSMRASKPPWMDSGSKRLELEARR
jgi:hypothetical protein